MWPLAVCGIVAAALIVWKLADISVKTSRNTRALDRVDDLIARRMIAEAHAAARESGSEAGRVIVAGLTQRGAGAKRIARMMGSAAAVETAALERGLIPLAAVAIVAPLCGFLVGVLAALANVRAADAGTIGESAAGAAVALPVATGLVIGIAAALFYRFCASRIARIAARIGATGRAAVDAISAVETGPSTGT
jgi:biopolymer transport protein ExbB/TolQ